MPGETEEAEDAEDVGHRIVRAMRACDGEMYSGWCGEVGLADADVHARVRRLAEEVAAVLGAGQPPLLMS